MRNYAILIDAGFLKRKLGSKESPVTANKIIDFVDRITRHERLHNLVLHRVYYYDAPPIMDVIENPLSKQRVNLGQTEMAKTNKALLDHLSRAPFFALRLGDVAMRGWKVPQRVLKNGDVTGIASVSANDIQPNIMQKGVDMRIGLDIASLTLKKHIDIVVLVTGDSDFVPVMKFARKEGAQLFLITLNHSVKEALIEHSDLILEI
ncbi:NYN domain-containing protein [Methylomonas sp. SURF-2]|uniref:NYN domain-containing protein n=1 Tax=Methylomonas subterranea TaxID=2952225 RepID=A0ABT1TAK8_9GAMM|nr:NYN domain-containing protein [Methylomonas sp. SURF-2]MCQ8102505.1 NYN domain-containing protein [Methylomonas sp. SURF-2]